MTVIALCFLTNACILQPVKEWLKLGGVRIDGAVTYATQWGVR